MNVAFSRLWGFVGVMGAAATACTVVRESGSPQSATSHTAATKTPRPTPDSGVVPAQASDAGYEGGVIAFPGAQGFGAMTKGGRGGPACVVTTLGKTGAGSFQACLDQSGPRIIVFEVSGVIEGPFEIRHGQLTIAGQTSPSGITLAGGLICDNVYDPYDCNDVILRHVRLRRGWPDSLRLSGAHDVIVDHCSLAAAEDENLEISRSRNITLQHSIVAEPQGEHYQWGGVLINYSKDVMPLDRITIHHTVWNGVSGRLPEISCEDNDDGPGKSNCRGHVLSIDLTNNVAWDVYDPIWFNHCTGTNEGNDCADSANTFSLALNLVGNILARRSSGDADAPLAEPSTFSHPRAQVFSAGNQLWHGAEAAKNANGESSAARHAFPSVTETPIDQLLATLAQSAGAFPRDAMDTRLSGYLVQPVDARPVAWRNGNGIDVGDALTVTNSPAKAPVDTDHDGMPDEWETQHGLNPQVVDGSSVEAVKDCATGYSAIECYVNALADERSLER
jgi:pectate lyase